MNAALKRLGGAGAATQAIILASLLLVASAVFLSQTDKIFAKAASSNIRGTMVLVDKSGSGTQNNIGVLPFNQTSPIALPGTSCTLQISACDVANSYGSGTSKPSVYFDGTMQQPGTTFTAGDSCTTTTQIPSVMGGIHTVGAANMMLSQAYNGLASLTVAYDCTP